MSKTVCFTGRRPKYLCGYNGSSYIMFQKYLTSYLEEMYLVSDVKTFISGGAQGFDQIAFWAVDSLKERYSDIKNIVYVPFRTQSSAWKDYGLFSKSEYNKMLDRADDVINVSGVISPSDYRQAAKLLMKRNDAMIDNSDIVIALYADDDWQTASGGTAEAMRYAIKNSKEMIQLKYRIENDNLVV